MYVYAQRSRNEASLNASASHTDNGLHPTTHPPTLTMHKVAIIEAKHNCIARLIKVIAESSTVLRRRAFRKKCGACASLCPMP